MVSSLKKKPMTFDKAINIEYNFKYYNKTVLILILN